MDDIDSKIREERVKDLTNGVTVTRDIPVICDNDSWNLRDWWRNYDGVKIKDGGVFKRYLLAPLCAILLLGATLGIALLALYSANNGIIF